MLDLRDYLFSLNYTILLISSIYLGIRKGKNVRFGLYL